MTKEKFLQTVEKENLLYICVLGAPKFYLKEETGRTECENTYGVDFIKGRWYPYKTDERGGMICFGEYSSESDALEKLLSVMRRKKRESETA